MTPTETRRALVVFAAAFLLAPPLRAEWSQFHANAAGTGFNPVVTSPAEKVTWWALLGGSGKNLGRSPVVAKDGTVYVSVDGAGRDESQVVAFSPSGSEKWRAQVGSLFSLSTPAVDPDGNVYVIGVLTAYVDDHRDGGDLGRGEEYQSVLVSLDPSGAHRWTYRLEPSPDVDFDNYRPTGRMQGSPRILIEEGGRTVVLLQFSYSFYGSSGCRFPHLLAVDGGSGAEIARFSLGCVGAIDLQGGSGGSSWPDPVPPPAGLTPLPQGERGPTSSLAVVTTPEHGTLAIAVDRGYDTNGEGDGQAFVAAAQWTGSGFTPAWTRRFRDYPIYPGSPSPAAYLNGVLAVGPQWARRMLFLPENGEDWGAPTPFSSGVVGTPASSLSAIYGATVNGEMFGRVSDGQPFVAATLPGQTTSSPAMSWNHVFIHSAEGIHTFSLLLEPEAFVPFVGAGTSSPAIADNGMVFVQTGSFLLAFGDPPAKAVTEPVIDRLGK